MRAILVAAIILCAPPLVAAQPSPAGPAGSWVPPAEGAHATTAAIDAILRGDYAQAAAILTPIVDRWAEETEAVSVAAFFMATLYENGLGVPQDRARACALYARSEVGNGPFARVAGQLMRASMDGLETDLASSCVMMAGVGVNHGFTPASFTLDVDHSVSIDLASKNQEVVATVSFRGNDKEAALQLPLTPGAIFLPIKYTALDSRDGLGPRRHFIEASTWVPVSESRWELAWTLSEIVQADVVAVASEVLTLFEAEMPPSTAMVELRDLVTLHVNDAGHVEFGILGGPDPRREGIPTYAERKELEDLEKKRKAADQKVNWKRRRSPDRPPAFAYADADGCGDLLLYGWSAERAESIAIRADKDLLQLSPASAPHVLDLAAQAGNIEVFTDVFDRPQRNWAFCTDVIVREEGPNATRQGTWRAVTGTVTIQLSAPGIRAGNPNQYRATIQIDNAEFLGPTGDIVRAAKPIRVTAVAGAGNAAP